jgi:hypothetical protein
MVLHDPHDLYVNWHRIEEPGDNPTWESKCGRIEQRSFGDRPSYYGFVGSDLKPIPTEFTTTFMSAKKIVERTFAIAHPVQPEEKPLTLADLNPAKHVVEETLVMSAGTSVLDQLAREIFDAGLYDGEIPVGGSDE